MLHLSPSSRVMQAIDQSGYRELLLDTQMLYKDLENTLGDKQHTMVPSSAYVLNMLAICGAAVARPAITATSLCRRLA